MTPLAWTLAAVCAALACGWWLTWRYGRKEDVVTEAAFVLAGWGLAVGATSGLWAMGGYLTVCGVQVWTCAVMEVAALLLVVTARFVS